MRLSSGDRLGPYEIVDAIGAGGMGVVYRARDTRLGRTVAIKLVNDVSTDRDAGARLVREAQHASALNHPNICVIHEIGDADGQPFIVMEYVDGQPLSEATPRAGFPAEQVVALGIQIADAVAHAHDHGIVHRDLKLSNVIVTPEGRPKVLDFGLATRTLQNDATQAPTIPATRAGTVVGTIAYMAPEVLQGHTADVRSDIWALGAILYKIASGEPPFGGQTEFEISAHILRDAPDPLPSDLPAGIAATISRCLVKSPSQRYQHASEVRAALEASRSAVVVLPQAHRKSGRVGVALAVAAILLAVLAALWWRPFLTSGTSVSAIAVAPFVNASSDPDTEYLSDGITESVINSLAQLPPPSPKVIALNSVLRYRGRDIDPQSMGRDLAVQAIVYGRVVHRPDMLSVSAELVDVRSKSRMWGATYNMKMADMLAMQDDIATNISDSLRLRLDRDGKKKLTKRYTENVKAYQLYLKGRYVWNKYTEEGWTTAIDYFRQALDVDPGYALAWAGIADSYYQLSSTVALPSRVIPAAKSAALKALALDDALAEAHASLGVIKAQYDWDRSGAAKEFRRALELNPSYASAHQWYGMSLYATGRFADALAEFRRAQELDPLSLIIAVTAVWPLPHLGRHEDAIAQVQKVMDMHPELPDLRAYFHELRGDLHLRHHRYDDAVADLVQGFRNAALTGGGADTAAVLMAAYTAAGINGYWQKQLELATAHYQHEVEHAKGDPQSRYITPYRLAELNARLGDKERAFALLEACYDNRDENLTWLKAEASSADSAWQSLVGDGRFDDLLRRLGLQS